MMPALTIRERPRFVFSARSTLSYAFAIATSSRVGAGLWVGGVLRVFVTGCRPDARG
jgi:hypothetical protein